MMQLVSQDFIVIGALSKAANDAKKLPIEDSLKVFLMQACKQTSAIDRFFIFCWKNIRKF